MSNNLLLGRYYGADTFIHKLDPLTKVLSLILFVSIVIISNNLFIDFLLLFYTLYLFYSIKIKFYSYIKSFKTLSIFLIFIILINIIFGNSLINILMMLIEIVLLINYSSIFTLSTKPMDINRGFVKLLSIFSRSKCNVLKISFSISVSLKFIPVIYDQIIKIMRSQASRGLDYFNNNIKNKIQSLKSILIPMFILSIKKADKLAEALELRNFTFNNRTYYNETKLNKYDYLVISCHSICLFFIIGLEVFI